MSNLLQTVIPASILARQRRITQYGASPHGKPSPHFTGMN
jgi:hypothetical protein